MKPVLFILDEAGEGTEVRYFCTPHCRDTYLIDDVTTPGESEDWIKDTVCDNCGSPLEAAL